MKVYQENSIILRNPATEKIIVDRLRESNGKILYILGDEDQNGNAMGIKIKDIDVSIENLFFIANNIEAEVNVLKIIAKKNNTYIGLVRITR